MQKKTLDDYSIRELLNLSIEQLLELRRQTVQFIIQTLDPKSILADENNNKNNIL